MRAYAVAPRHASLGNPARPRFQSRPFEEPGSQGSVAAGRGPTVRITTTQSQFSPQPRAGQSLTEAFTAPRALAFERAFDADFSTVRLHPHALPRALGAAALTQNEHVYLATSPSDTESGRALVGHELTHVLQQRGTRVARPQHPGAWHINPLLEQEADRLGDRVARDQSADVPEQRLPGAHARRSAAQPRQPKLAVAVRTNNGAGLGATIQSVDIVGRPKRLKFPRAGGGTTEGDHSTAWALFQVGVVNRLTGRTLIEAITQLHALVDEARALPGARDDRVDAMPLDRRLQFMLADTELASARMVTISAVHAASQDWVISAIQNYVASYLAYRNAVGLSVRDFESSATTDGETQPLQTLQYWERNWVDAGRPTAAQQNTILLAMGKLLSGKVYAQADSATRANMPGMKDAESVENLRMALRDQHERSLHSAYRNLWARLTPAQKNAIAPGAAWDGTHMPAASAVPATGKSWAVQIRIGGDGTITRVMSAGRSAHGMGNSQGSHTTAYGLFERALNRLVGKTLPGAKAELDTIREIFEALPGAKPTRTARMGPERRRLFLVARAGLAVARGAADASATVPTLQAYAEALLAFRNTMGLVTLHGGGVPSSKIERLHLSALDAFEEEIRSTKTKIDRAPLAQAIADVFDRTTLSRYFDSPGVNEAPGLQSGEGIDSVFKALFRQHLYTIEAAYPLVFSVLDDAILNSIAALMRGDSAVDVDVASLITSEGRTQTNRLGKRGLSTAPSSSNARRKKSRKDDDDYFP